VIRVIRPGPWQYAYVLVLLALPIALGISTIQYGFTIQEHDWGNRIFFGLLEIAFGAVPAAYMLGMRVELTDRDVSKVFLFGLLRETIPRGRLAATVNTSYDQYGFEVALAKFKRVDGPGAFKLYRKWVWRAADIDDLLVLASEPWHDDVFLHRQNRRLIVALWTLGVLVAAVVGIHSWGMNANR
jgi:hypothetical protein